MIPRRATQGRTSSPPLSGTCRDKAGNSNAASFALKYDATAPAASATPSRQPNAAGWYKAPLTVSFAATDATSGLASCPAPKDYAGPDNATASVGGTLPRRRRKRGHPLAPPRTTRPRRRQAPRPPVPPTSAAGSTTPLRSTSRPRTRPPASPPARPRKLLGPGRRSGLDRRHLPRRRRKRRHPVPDAQVRRDRTADNCDADAFGQRERLVQRAGPGRLRRNGRNGRRGPCEAQKTYSGPDSALAAVVGSCRPGRNTGAASFGLKYDATAPQTTATPGRAPDSNGWYRAALTVSFAGTDATAGIESCDAPKNYSGPDNAGASVNGSCRDLAATAQLAPSCSGTTRRRPR